MKQNDDNQIKTILYFLLGYKNAVLKSLSIEWAGDIGDMFRKSSFHWEMEKMVALLGPQPSTLRQH